MSPKVYSSYELRKPFYCSRHYQAIFFVFTRSLKSLTHPQDLIGYFSLFNSVLKKEKYLHPHSILIFSGAHNPEPPTTILGLSHGVVTDRFIFRYILGHAHFPRKWKLPALSMSAYRKGNQALTNTNKTDICTGLNLARLE